MARLVEFPARRPAYDDESRPTNPSWIDFAAERDGSSLLEFAQSDEPVSARSSKELPLHPSLVIVHNLISARNVPTIETTRSASIWRIVPDEERRSGGERIAADLGILSGDNFLGQLG
ncbi:MAG: hypothetical protein ACI9BW_001599 [Gammaproteobacteria bacterium]